MTENLKKYKGYEYVQLGDGTWKVYFPGGGRMTTLKQTEAQLLASIDSHEADDSQES